MNFYMSGNEDQGRFKITGLYGVPFSEEEGDAGSWRPVAVGGKLVDGPPGTETTQALLQAQQQLRALLLAQDEVQGRERHRIAQDVHDELGGLLTCINAYLGVYLDRIRQRGEAPDALLCEANNMATEAIRAVQKIATSLRPSVLDNMGVWAAIEAALAKLATYGNLACHCDIDPALAALALGHDVELALYRIVQEALTNVTRHAKASRVTLVAQRSAAGLRLTLRDNGVGLRADAGRARSGWGIAGMRERAARVNGSLSLGPAAAGGTELVLELPVGGEHGA